MQDISLAKLDAKDYTVLPPRLGVFATGCVGTCSMAFDFIYEQYFKQTEDEPSPRKRMSKEAFNIVMCMAASQQQARHLIEVARSRELDWSNPRFRELAAIEQMRIDLINELRFTEPALDYSLNYGKLVAVDDRKPNQNFRGNTPEKQLDYAAIQANVELLSRFGALGDDDDVRQAALKYIQGLI